MSTRKDWYLVAYDVREPKRLRRVAKHLEGYGHRVQYSLFRCRLTAREKERLRWELVQIMEAEDDLLVIGLCGNCAARVVTSQAGQEWDQPPPTFDIV